VSGDIIPVPLNLYTDFADTERQIPIPTDTDPLYLQNAMIPGISVHILGFSVQFRA